MNEHKFDKKGEIYSKARPSYPDKLFIYLKDQNLISKKHSLLPIHYTMLYRKIKQTLRLNFKRSVFLHSVIKASFQA